MSVRRPHPEVLGLFKALSAMNGPELEALAAALVIRQVAAGGRLFEEGQVADGCFLIATGRVRVTVRRPDGPEQLAMLGRGDLAGQMSLLDGGKRSATCSAVEDVVAFYMSRDEFDVVFRSGSSFALKFVDALTRRLVAQLRYANRRLYALSTKQPERAPRRARPRDRLADVARRSMAGEVDDMDLDAVEVVIPEGMRKD